MTHRLEFDWDPVKAASNLVKHEVSFDESMAVFSDPLALSRPDEDHRSRFDERWISIGRDPHICGTRLEPDVHQDHLRAKANETRKTTI